MHTTPWVAYYLLLLSSRIEGPQESGHSPSFIWNLKQQQRRLEPSVWTSLYAKSLSPLNRSKISEEAFLISQQARSCTWVPAHFSDLASLAFSKTVVLLWYPPSVLAGSKCAVWSCWSLVWPSEKIYETTIEFTVADFWDLFCLDYPSLKNRSFWSESPLHGRQVIGPVAA